MLSLFKVLVRVVVYAIFAVVVVCVAIAWFIGTVFDVQHWADRIRQLVAEVSLNWARLQARLRLFDQQSDMVVQMRQFIQSLNGKGM